MSTLLRTGVIGLGILGSQHARLIHKRADFELTAVADLRADLAQSLAAETGASPYTEYQEMLREHALDLVVIATPDPYHRKPALAALSAGVPNLLMEKPLATTIDDAKRIVEAAQAHQARVLINFANRAAPGDKATRRVIQSGLLGKVVYGEARLDDNISVPTGLWGARSQAWASGSSTAHFLLSHVVDILRYYFCPSEVTDVYAISQSEVLGFTPDLYDAYLTMSTGQTIRVKAEWIKHMEQLVEYYLCFSGSEGTVIYNKLPAFNVAPGWRLNVDNTSSPSKVADQADGLAALGLEPTWEMAQDDEKTPRWFIACQGKLTGDFMAMPGILLDAVAEDTLTPKTWQGLGPVPNLTDGLRQTEVVAAIIRSADTGKPVSLG